MAEALDSSVNPIQTDGFEFVEYAAPDPAALGALFERMGFQAVARHRHKSVTLYKQGDVNFIINAEPRSFAQNFARRHGPSVCAIAFRVRDTARAYEKLVERGAWGVESRPGRGEPPGARRAQHPGDQGHRRLPHLPRRPLPGERGRQHDLRRRLPPAAGL